MIYIDISSGDFLQGQLCLSVIIQDGLMLNKAGKWWFKLWEEMNLLLWRIIQPVDVNMMWFSCSGFPNVIDIFLWVFKDHSWFKKCQHYGIFAIRTILYVAGYLVEKHQASMKVTDVLLNRKPEWNLEDTVVFPCLKLKHELLLSRTIYFAFVFLHGCWNETIEHEWNRWDRLGIYNVIFNMLKLITTACLQYVLLYYKAILGSILLLLKWNFKSWWI